MEQQRCLQYRQRPLLYFLGRICGPVRCTTKEGECCHKKSTVCINYSRDLLHVNFGIKIRLYMFCIKHCVVAGPHMARLAEKNKLRSLTPLSTPA